MPTSDGKSSNRGGPRPGSGRPKQEKTVQIRVPVGAVDAVRSVIDLYKKTGLKPDTEIKKGQVDWTDELKSDTETSILPERIHSPPPASKIKKATPAEIADAIGLIMRKSNRRERRAMISKHGSIEAAARYFVEHEPQRTDGGNMGF